MSATACRNNDNRYVLQSGRITESSQRWTRRSDRDEIICGGYYGDVEANRNKMSVYKCEQEQQQPQQKREGQLDTDTCGLQQQQQLVHTVIVPKISVTKNRVI
jgi:hypothetical protein